MVATSESRRNSPRLRNTVGGGPAPPECCLSGRTESWFHRGQGQPHRGTSTILPFRQLFSSGPRRLHVHHAEDEAWHMLDGELTFRYADREEIVRSGTTVFVPQACRTPTAQLP